MRSLILAAALVAASSVGAQTLSTNGNSVTGTVWLSSSQPAVPAVPIDGDITPDFVRGVCWALKANAANTTYSTSSRVSISNGGHSFGCP